jgi:hypothetical protein
MVREGSGTKELRRLGIVNGRIFLRRWRVTAWGYQSNFDLKIVYILDRMLRIISLFHVFASPHFSWFHLPKTIV